MKQEEILKEAEKAFEASGHGGALWPVFRDGYLAGMGMPGEAVIEVPEVATVLMSRKEVEELTGRTPYAIKKAVEEGRLDAYNGPLATKGALYYSVDVVEWMKSDE